MTRVGEGRGRGPSGLADRYYKASGIASKSLLVGFAQMNMPPNIRRGCVRGMTTHAMTGHVYMISPRALSGFKFETLDKRFYCI